MRARGELTACGRLSLRRAGPGQPGRQRALHARRHPPRLGGHVACRLQVPRVTISPVSPHSPAEVAGFAGEGLVCGGADPGRRDLTNRLVASLDGGSGLPRLDTSRLRATWLRDGGELPGLAAFMAAAGISCSQRPGDLIAGLEPGGEEQAVRLLGAARP